MSELQAIFEARRNKKKRGREEEEDRIIIMAVQAVVRVQVVQVLGMAETIRASWPTAMPPRR